MIEYILKLQMIEFKHNSFTGNRLIDLTAIANDLFLPYFKQPRSQLPVQHDIESEHLEAHTVRAWCLSGTTHPVGMQNVRMCHDHGLDDHVRDVPPQEGHVVVMSSEVVVEEVDGSLTSCLDVVGLDIFIAVLVDRVVSQVHE